jgi:hypothetical protein
MSRSTKILMIGLVMVTTGTVLNGRAEREGDVASVFLSRRIAASQLLLTGGLLITGSPVGWLIWILATDADDAFFFSQLLCCAGVVLLGIVLAITAIIRLAGRGVEKLSKNRLAAGGQ